MGQLLTSALAMGIVLTICLEYSGPALLKIMGSSPENEAKVGYRRAPVVPLHGPHRSNTFVSDDMTWGLKPVGNN